MSGVIEEVNRGLVSLLDELQGEPMLLAKVRFCVIGFADDTRCYLEPSDLRDLEDMPTLSAGGSTSYAAAFRALRDRIPQDVSNLKSQGFIVYRPAVLFLTDGAPNPGWESAYDDLTGEGFAQRPNVLAFGIGKADASVIKQVATRDEFAFIAASGVDIGKAIVYFSIGRVS